MNVGFIGLGNIGKPMAMNVVNAGHRTKVHDIRPEAATDLLEAGAVWAETPADAARGVMWLWDRCLVHWRSRRW